MSRQLPPQPHLDVLKKQARQLLTDHQAGDSEAVERVQAVLADLPPSAAEAFTLRHAQQVLAREYGFTSWQALVDHVGRPGGEAPPALPVHYDQLARDLVDALDGGRLQSFGRLGEEFRDHVTAAAAAGSADGEHAEQALEQARLAVAAHNGCDSWEGLAGKVQAAAHGALMDLPQLRGFEHMHDELAALLATRFASILGPDQPAQARIAFTDQTSYGEFVLSQSVPACVFRLTPDGLGGDLVLSLGPALVNGLLAAAQGDRSAQLEELGRGMAQDLEAVWNPVTDLAVRPPELHTDRFAIQAVPMCEIGVLIAVEARTEATVDEPLGLVEVFYPSSAIRGVMDGLAAHAPPEHR